MTSLIGEQFDCSNSIPCTQTHHEVASTRSHLNPNENPEFRIEYARNETEIYQYSKKVSTQGLIGQVGGIQGAPYHNGRHPLRKIIEENRNIQNYQPSIEYEL